MTITATYIKPIPANNFTAACFTISADAASEDWAALPKSITKNWKPNYRFTIDLRPTTKNPINEAGIKKIRRILDTLNIVDAEKIYNSPNVCGREEFRDLHGV